MTAGEGNLQYLRLLSSWGIALLIDILNPEVIILGSIFGRSGSLLSSAMYNVLQQEALQSAYSSCKIVSAGLGESIGDYAALSLAAI